MEGAALQCGQSFLHQLHAAVDEAALLGAVFQRAPRDILIIGLVRLAEVGRIAVGNRSLLAHPVNGRAGIQAAGEGDANFFPNRKTLQNIAHESFLFRSARPSGWRPGVCLTDRDSAEVRLSTFDYKETSSLRLEIRGQGLGVRD